jgi:hypothetical protein
VQDTHVQRGAHGYGSHVFRQALVSMRLQPVSEVSNRHRVPYTQEAIQASPLRDRLVLIFLRSPSDVVIATPPKKRDFQILVSKIASTVHLYTSFRSAAVAVKIGEHSSGCLILGCL